MVTVPGQLIWEIMKNNNSFLVNVHSCKHSGFANKKTVTIQSEGKDQSVLLATSKTKKQSKPVALLNKSIMKKDLGRMAKAVQNQVSDNYYRPDLKKAALARLSAVHSRRA